MKKKLAVALYVICIAACVWVFASWLDVVLNNLGSMQYACWNVFKILF